MQRRLMVSWFLTAAFVGAMGSLAAACGGDSTGEGSASSNTSSNNNPSGISGCTPNQAVACACETGEMGSQTCNSDGAGFTPCQCGSSSAVCGNSKVEAGEECDDGNSVADDGCSATCKTEAVEVCGNGKPDPGECGPEGDCPQDCTCGDGKEQDGECGAGGTCPADCCLPENVQIYAGKIDDIGPARKFQGFTGIEAGDAMCKALVGGSDHACTYEEVIQAEKEGELVGVMAGRTAWVHRTTTVDVNGKPSPAGPGGRCNDWKYETNHAADGEWLMMKEQGVAEYHFDDDTIFDQVAPHTQPGALQCGNELRDIFCCYTACVK